jgi:hypothetical protein
MGITEDIKRVIQSKLIIRYKDVHPDESDGTTTESCVLCSSSFESAGPLCLNVPGEGYVCETCGQRFAPEMVAALSKDTGNFNYTRYTECSRAEKISLKDLSVIEEHFNKLLSITSDLARGLARGIVEAPAGHIGLLYLAKDILKPDQKEGESDRDYELRVKSFRMQKLNEKIKAETWERINEIKLYLKKNNIL